MVYNLAPDIIGGFNGERMSGRARSFLSGDFVQVKDPTGIRSAACSIHPKTLTELFTMT